MGSSFKFCFALMYNQIIKPIVISIASTAIQIAIQVGIKCALVLSNVLIFLKLFVICGGCWELPRFQPPSLGVVICCPSFNMNRNVNF